MKRRFFLGAGLAGMSMSLLPSCTTSINESSGVNNETAKTGSIVHNVYFWLKEGITSEEEAEFLEFFRILKTVPGIKTLVIGKPAPTNPRPVVDNSFSYNLTVTFENLAAINIYETHPIHTDAASKYSKYWTTVQVKDSVVVDI